MLLAVFNLARAGGLTENRIRYAPPLLERFRRLFKAVRAPVMTHRFLLRSGR